MIIHRLYTILDNWIKLQFTVYRTMTVPEFIGYISVLMTHSGLIR